MERLLPLATFIGLMLVGLVAGIFVATQLGQLRVQNMLGARDFTLVKHSFEVALGGIMPPLVIAAGLSIIPSAVVRVSAGPLRLVPVVVAFLLWVGVVIATVVLCAPVNALAAGWDPATPPDNWEALRDRWHLGQTIRTPLAVAAFATLAFAAVLPPEPGA
jgi:hypothetical protein